MIQKNPYAAYNNSKIQTATPAELTLLQIGRAHV